MNKIQGIHSYTHLRSVDNQPKTGPPNVEKPASPAKKTDQVEISHTARYLSMIAALPDVRLEKVEALRQEIVQGTYDVENKLPEALDKMLDEYIPG